MRGRGRAKRVARYEMALMECDNAEMPREGEKRVSASIFIHPSIPLLCSISLLPSLSTRSPRGSFLSEMIDDRKVALGEEFCS